MTSNLEPLSDVAQEIIAAQVATGQFAAADPKKGPPRDRDDLDRRHKDRPQSIGTDADLDGLSESARAIVLAQRGRPAVDTKPATSAPSRPGSQSGNPGADQDADIAHLSPAARDVILAQRGRPSADSKPASPSRVPASSERPTAPRKDAAPQPSPSSSADGPDEARILAMSADEWDAMSDSTKTALATSPGAAFVEDLRPGRFGESIGYVAGCVLGRRLNARRRAVASGGAS